MADNNYNIIKPVEGLQNIGGLKPTKRRKERKERQNSGNQKEERDQEPNSDLIEEELEDETTESQTDQYPDSAGIDYRA